MIKIDIVKAAFDDLHQLNIICRETFYESFSGENTEVDMQSYLEETFSPQNLTAELMDENTQIYFAKHQNEILGYLKLNFGNAQTHLKDDTAIQIERLYIKKENQNQNIGQNLLDKAIEIAKFHEKKLIWLGVWEKNFGAIKFYQRNGFTAFGNYIFTLGKDKQQDILMKLVLSSI